MSQQSDSVISEPRSFFKIIQANLPIQFCIKWIPLLTITILLHSHHPTHTSLTSNITLTCWNYLLMFPIFALHLSMLFLFWTSLRICITLPGLFTHAKHSITSFLYHIKCLTLPLFFPYHYLSFQYFWLLLISSLAFKFYFIFSWLVCLLAQFTVLFHFIQPLP